MDSPFIYDRSVTGKSFIGRREDCTVVTNLIFQRENVVIFGGAKTGKKSLVQQAMYGRRMIGERFAVADIDLLSVRDSVSFAKRLGDAVVRAYATTPAEYAEMIKKYLPGTHFVFDRKRFSDYDEIISLNWDLDEQDMRSILMLPYQVAFDKSMPLIIILNEFQNVEFFDDSFMVYKQLESVIKEIRGRLEEPMCSFVFMGSQGNAMKEIFCHQHRLYRLVEHFTPSEINEKDIVSHVEKGFLSGGKVLQKETIMEICKLFRNNIWYIQHFVSICDHLSRGFVSDAILNDAMNMLLSVHEPKFISMMNELTTFQVNLLRAVLDGNTKISGAEIIRTYSLSSSANVKRLKDALVKKEIITVDTKDNLSIIDPLFEHWLTKRYFKIQE